MPINKMKLNAKEYKRIKTKKYLKKTKLFFFFNGVNIDSHEWRKTEQSLNKLSLIKKFDKVTDKDLDNSIFKNFKKIAHGPTFFIASKNKQQFSKDTLLKLPSLLLTLLAIKIDNKIYPRVILEKNQNSINYYNNSLLFYQLSITHLKSSTKLISKKSK